LLNDEEQRIFTVAEPPVFGSHGEASTRRGSTNGELEPYGSEDLIRQLTDTKSVAESADAGSDI
jgi:hypothetical protein